MTIRDIEPTALVQARTETHLACQWPSRAARANLAAKPDDSHSNLGWRADLAALLSHPLDDAATWQAGFCFDNCALLWLKGGAVQDELPLDGLGDNDARVWLDERLEAAGLKPTRFASMPYDLGVAKQYDFSTQAQQTRALGKWFALGFAVLSRLVESYGRESLIEPAVRLWPHHYDVGTLFTLEAADPETARSIGVGLSPGDDAYAEPYFYASPWPVPSAEELPTAPSGLGWHTDGFTSMVVTGSNLDMEDAAGLLAGGMDVLLEMLAEPRETS